MSAQPQTGVERVETILLVEDKPYVRTLLRNGLEARGFHVLEASCGEEALHIAKQHGEIISLVVTDVVMPTLSGPKLAAKLKREYPWLCVLFMSGHSVDLFPDDPVAFDLQFIQKPFSPRELATKIRELLDRSYAG